MKRKERRDENVLAYCRREISLSTRMTRDKTKYTRKQKHKLKLYVWVVAFKAMVSAKTIKYWKNRIC